MPTITIGAGVGVDLSAEWAPLADARILLINAWARYRLAIAASGRWWLFEAAWDLLLLRLWREDKIELAARRGDPEAELTPLRVPVSERISQNFDKPGPYSRMFYRLTETMLFDVHVRAKPTAEPDHRVSRPPQPILAAAPEPERELPPRALPRGRAKTRPEQRDELVYSAAKHPIDDDPRNAWRSWRHGPDALAATRRKFPEQAKTGGLLAIGKSETAACWGRVKRRLEDDNPEHE